MTLPKIANSYGQIFHLACYSSLVPLDNSTEVDLNVLLYSLKLCEPLRRTDIKSPSTLLQITQALELMGVFSDSVISFFQPVRKLFCLL